MEVFCADVMLSNSKLLCIGGELPRESVDAVQQYATFCDGFGYYLCVADASRPRDAVNILAKFTSEEAAIAFSRLIGAQTPFS